MFVTTQHTPPPPPFPLPNIDNELARFLRPPPPFRPVRKHGCPLPLPLCKRRSHVFIRIFCQTISSPFLFFSRYYMFDIENAFDTAIAPLLLPFPLPGQVKVWMWRLIGFFPPSLSPLLSFPKRLRGNLRGSLTPPPSLVLVVVRR